MHATSSTVMFIREVAMAPAPAIGASFTAQVWHSGSGADRWNRFLCEFCPGGESLIVAVWWRKHSRVWDLPGS